jgi:hypothetical protein
MKTMKLLIRGAGELHAQFDVNVGMGMITSITMSQREPQNDPEFEKVLHYFNYEVVPYLTREDVRSLTDWVEGFNKKYPYTFQPKAYVCSE